MGIMDAACPVSTGGGTRRVQLVRGEGACPGTWAPLRCVRGALQLA
jgi:hypothetical protein